MLPIQIIDHDQYVQWIDPTIGVGIKVSEEYRQRGNWADSKRIDGVNDDQNVQRVNLTVPSYV
jgi:hypothetical protein